MHDLFIMIWSPTTTLKVSVIDVHISLLYYRLWSKGMNVLCSNFGVYYNNKVYVYNFWEADIRVYEMGVILNWVNISTMQLEKSDVNGCYTVGVSQEWSLLSVVLAYLSFTFGF